MLAYIVLRDHLEGENINIPSLFYAGLPRTEDCAGFSILDDDDITYFSGYIYNVAEAEESEFDELFEFMELYGATKLMINGEVII